MHMYEALEPMKSSTTTPEISRRRSPIAMPFSTVGGDVALRSFAVLKPGGRAAFIASGAQAPRPRRAGVPALRPPVGRARVNFERLVELFQAGGGLRPEIRLCRLSGADDGQQPSRS